MTRMMILVVQTALMFVAPRAAKHVLAVLPLLRAQTVDRLVRDHVIHLAQRHVKELPNQVLAQIVVPLAKIHVKEVAR